jgi:hypothetical protein
MFWGGTTKTQYTTHRGKSASLMRRCLDVQRAVSLQGLQKGVFIFFSGRSWQTEMARVKNLYL